MLRIRLTPGKLRPPLGISTVDQLRGGPETLLGWLETQLGLPNVESPRASFVTEYAAALDTVCGGLVSKSVATDRWATASELLGRRDQLLLAGWNERHLDELPELVNDLARAVTARTIVFSCEAERLGRVIEALDDGQSLPAHRCILADPVEKWPARWQQLLARLTLERADDDAPAAAVSTALYAAQRVVKEGKVARTQLDPSLRFVRTLSQTAAVEFVAATLALDRSKLARTTILCEDDGAAHQLDACLNRRGLSTMGATVYSKAHPALQILPLALALCWQPVDPQALLDFLSLPISPIPRRAASTLAAALAAEPGLGSSRWQAAFDDLCCATKDPEGKLSELLAAWLFCERVPHSDRIPSKLVRSRCGAVAQWAAGRAILAAQDAQVDLQLVAALQTAAGQAKLLGELAESQGALLTKPQLARLTEEALAQGVETVAFIEAEGGPTRVRSLAEIDQPCDQLIWLGIGTADAVPCSWSSSHLTSLASAGVTLDDGSKTLSALRSAEAAGFCRVTASVLAVRLPRDEQRRLHPIWLAIKGGLQSTEFEEPPVLENLIHAGDLSSLTPFVCELQTSAAEVPQPLRSHWDIPRELLRDRETVSASELGDRLACPLKWVLNYQANLRSSPIARLPDEFRLKGNFCHNLLHRVFNGLEELPAAEDAVARILKAFDERINLDAAPLAQPDRTLERERLRQEMENSTRVLIETLASGGYRIKGIEVAVTGRALGKELKGSIDCLVERADGTEAIIDFKYGGRSKYSTLITEGKAVQLATYAYSRYSLGTQANKNFPAVAYLVLSDGLLFTPAGSPIAGDCSRSLIDGPAIETVWRQFEAAIRESDGWLLGAIHVPARPHLEANDWPDGAHIVLDKKLKGNETQAVCKYCEYTQICGLQELT